MLVLIPHLFARSVVQQLLGSFSAPVLCALCFLTRPNKKIVSALSMKFTWSEFLSRCTRCHPDVWGMNGWNLNLTWFKFGQTLVWQLHHKSRTCTESKHQVLFQSDPVIRWSMVGKACEHGECCFLFRYSSGRAEWVCWRVHDEMTL